MSFRSKRARLRQSFTSSRSPCTTWISTLRLAVDGGGELSRSPKPGWSNCDESASTPGRPWSRCPAKAASRRAAADPARRPRECRPARPRPARPLHPDSARYAAGAEQLLDCRAHQRNARRPAHHHDFVDLLNRHARVLRCTRGKAPASDRRSAGSAGRKRRASISRW